MHRPARPFLAIGYALALAADAPAAEPAGPVEAVVESTLATDSDRVRQFAFDGDASTYYASERNPGGEDSFTLAFDAPVSVRSVEVWTGKPDGSDEVEGGSLEGSEDGRTFRALAPIKASVARAEPGARLKAIRIKAKPGAKHPLVVREIAVDSDPKVATFRHPVEYRVDVSEAPEMKDWADNAARACERWYGRIGEELKSDGYRPIRVVRMRLSRDIRVPAMAGGGRITGSVQWFKDHPDDVGAMIHETVHIIQNYRGRNNPGWLVEGLADYIRFFRYEPGKVGRLDVRRARYDGSYRVTARFLDYLARTYDTAIVARLNKAMREGTYRDELFQECTGKPLAELGEEWKASLTKPEGGEK